MNALTEMLSHPLVYRLGWALVHLLWQGFAVAMLLGIVLLVFRKSSANVRYLAGCSALGLIVLLPIVTFGLVAAPPSHAPVEIERASLPAFTGEAAITVPVELEFSAPDPTAMGLKERVVNLLEPALGYIVAGWVLGVFALSLWHLGGWTHLQRLRRRLTKHADEALLARLSALAEKLKVSRPVRLLESAIVQIPTVVGWFRPVILLPATALTGLTGEQLEALLAHELAHIRRGDYLVNMLQTVVEIFGFYHPAVWWISNKIRVERENCCDDIAVAVCSDKMHYATALAEMERIRSSQGELAVAANGGNLLSRIRRLIVKGATPKSRFNWAAALVTALAIAALAIPTSLALSGKYSGKTSSEPIVVAASEVAEKLAAAAAGEEGRGVTTIIYDCKIFELYGGSSAPELEPGDNTRDGLYVRTGTDYAQRLEKLAEEGRDVKLLAAPELLVVEGKDGTIKSESEYEYIKGYEDGPDGKSEAIKDTVSESMEITLMGMISASKVLRTELSFSRLIPAFETQKDAQGREVQIPKKTLIECATEVRSPDGEPFIIGGLKYDGEPEHQLILMITPSITPVEAVADADAERTVEGDGIVRPTSGSNSGRRVRRPGTVDEAAEEKAQILYEFRIFDISPNFRVTKEADGEGVFVRTDKAFGERLEALSQEQKDAKVLAAPRLLISEGEEAQMVMGRELPYTEGYTEQPGGEPKPIIKYFMDGMKHNVIGRVLDNDIVRTAIIFTFTDTTFSSHKVGKGREIQIPIVSKTESSMVINLPDGVAAYIGGFKNPNEPERSLILQVTSHILRPGEEPPLREPLPVTESEGKVSFEVTPQVTTRVSFGAPVDRPLPSDTQQISDLIKDFAAMIKGEGGATFELLELQATVKEQLDDLRRILDGRDFEIANARAEGRYAILVSKPIEADGEEGQLVFNLSKRGDKWIIDDIDFESPGGVKDEMKRFSERLLKAGFGAPGMGGPDERPEQLSIFEVRYSSPEVLSGVLKNLLTPEQSDVRISAVPSTMQLIVEGKASDVDQMGKLIKLLDVAQAAMPEEETVTRVVQLKYADSQEVAGMLSELSVLGRYSRVVTDARLHQLIVSAPEAEIERITALIEQLDKPVDAEAAGKQDVARDKQLAKLIQERESLAEKMQSLRAEISKMEQDFGIGDFGKAEDLMLQRAANIMNELARTESQRFQLESQLSLLQQGKDASVSGHEQLKMRQEYVSADATVKALAERIAQVETELLLAKQTKASDHPEVKSKSDLLKALKGRLSEAKNEVGQAFDKQMASQAEKTRLQSIDRLKTELDHNRVYEQKIRASLDRDNQKGVEMAQSKSQIQALHDELDAIKAMYDEVNRRITDIRMEPLKPSLYDIVEEKE